MTVQDVDSRRLDSGNHPLWRKLNILVGQQIKRLRLANGHTQTDLARIIGVTFQQGQKYESGATRLPVDRLYVLSRCYGVPADYFFDQPPEALAGTVEANPRSRLLLQLFRETEGRSPRLLSATLEMMRAALAEEAHDVP
jgi:transcriptional regulator with XRE-family HTH domain